MTGARADERPAAGRSDQPGVRHVVTGEFPPQPGGVSDYVRELAARLASAEGLLHVWCPRAPGGSPEPEPPAGPHGVVVHRTLGDWSLSDLRRTGHLLDGHPAPRRLLVQWVPHAFGWRGLNVPFCVWIAIRARRGERLEVMVHEPFLPFGGWSIVRNAAALVQRVMAMILLSGATRVWTSAGAWERVMRPYAPGRLRPFRELFIPSNVPPAVDPGGVAELRRQLLGEPPGDVVLGHFGTYGAEIRQSLAALVPRLLRPSAGRRFVLLGRGGTEVRQWLADAQPDLGARIIAPGSLDARTLSLYLQACDLLVQPYPDGVSGRRTTVMAALAHGRPVATTNGPLSEPLWQESGAVALAPAGDDAALAEVAERLIAQPDARARLGREGQALYRDRFDWPQTVRAILDGDEPTPRPV